MIYVGQILLSSLQNSSLSTQTANNVYGYVENLAVNATGGSFSTSTYVMKIKPTINDLYGYVVKSSIFYSFMPILIISMCQILFEKYKDLTSSFDKPVRFCTIRIINKGSNVPCVNLVDHNYGYDLNFIKRSAVSDFGPFCSISNSIF